MPNDGSARKALDRLADALVEDIMNLSDEEIMEEFREDHGDPERHIAEMRALVEKSVAIANRRRRDAAADALSAAVDALYTALRARALDEAQRVAVAVACAGLEDAQKAFKKARKGQGA